MDRGYASYLRYLDGDDSGINDIVEEYSMGLYLYLCGITGDHYLAEEAMEDAFVKLAVKKPDFKGVSSFKTWLYTVGRNCAVDRARKRSRESHLALDEMLGVPCDEDVERDYLKEERRLSLWHSMSSLKAEHRQVLCLVYIEGFSPTEAARIMKKSRHAIDNLLYRAKKALCDRLNEEGFEIEGF